MRMSNSEDSNTGQNDKSAPFTFKDAEKFIGRVKKDPTLLYREPEKSKKNLH